MFYGKQYNMARLHKITLTLTEGKLWVTDPALAFATPVRVAREGVGYNRIENFFTSDREYSFKTSGLFAWKVLFQTQGRPGGEKVHVIYTL